MTSPKKPVLPSATTGRDGPNGPNTSVNWNPEDDPDYVAAKTSNKTRRILIWAIAIFVIAAIGTFYEKHREREWLADLMHQSNIAIADVLGSSAFLQGGPPEEMAKIAGAVRTIDAMNSETRRSHLLFAREEQYRAQQYLEYLLRLSTKLRQVGESKAEAVAHLEDYNAKVEAIKHGLVVNRTGDLEAIGEAARAVRENTDIAYEECILLRTLIDGYAVARRPAEQFFSDQQLLPASAFEPLLQPLEDETHARRIIRKQFNAGAAG